MNYPSTINDPFSRVSLLDQLEQTIIHTRLHVHSTTTNVHRLKTIWPSKARNEGTYPPMLSRTCIAHFFEQGLAATTPASGAGSDGGDSYAIGMCITLHIHGTCRCIPVFLSSCSFVVIVSIQNNEFLVRHVNGGTKTESSAIVVQRHHLHIIITPINSPLHVFKELSTLMPVLAKWWWWWRRQSPP